MKLVSSLPEEFVLRHGSLPSSRTPWQAIRPVPMRCEEFIQGHSREAGERFENDGGLQSLKHLCPPAEHRQFIALGVQLDENPAAAHIRDVTV